MRATTCSSGRLVTAGATTGAAARTACFLAPAIGTPRRPRTGRASCWTRDIVQTLSAGKGFHIMRPAARRARMAAPKAEDRSTESLLRWVDGPLPKGEGVVARLDAVAAETGRPVHAELLKLLTHLSYPNETARRVWAGYQVHRATLQRRLGRDVGGGVGIFDALLNVMRRVHRRTCIVR